MQVPKIFPPSLNMTPNWALYMDMLKKDKTLRGYIDFWVGVLFPFVSDVRHKLLNLSSVRHSTNLQFANKEFFVGWKCPGHALEGNSSVNRYTATCRESHEVDACLDTKERFLSLMFLFLKKTCPSHRETHHRPRYSEHPQSESSGTRLECLQSQYNIKHE